MNEAFDRQIVLIEKLRKRAFDLLDRTQILIPKDMPFRVRAQTACFREAVRVPAM